MTSGRGLPARGAVGRRAVATVDVSPRRGREMRVFRVALPHPPGAQSFPQEVSIGKHHKPPGLAIDGVSRIGG